MHGANTQTLTPCRSLAALVLDHELTRTMLDVLEALARGLRYPTRFPAQDVAASLRFFREFFAHVHQPFEAATLYAVALAHGADGEVEIAGRLVADHDDTSALLHALGLLWEPQGELTSDERESFVEIANAFVARTRRHLADEERRLFPLLTTALAPADRAGDLLGDLAAEPPAAHADARARFARTAHELSARWLA